jgi:DNA transformation protein and related proteins
MAPLDDFILYLLELLEPLGPIKARPMFGGYGIYLDQLMFGIVVDDTFFLKADSKNRSQFESQGLQPFTYQKQGKEIKMSFYPAPADAMEDSELLCEWARASIQAAQRAFKQKK